jgi:hypothetical protein
LLFFLAVKEVLAAPLPRLYDALELAAVAAGADPAKRVSGFWLAGTWEQAVKRLPIFRRITPEHVPPANEVVSTSAEG